MAGFSSFPTNLDLIRKLSLRTAVTVVAVVIFFKFLFSCPCTSPEVTALHCWLYMLLPIGIMFFILILVDTQLLKLCQCFVCKCCVRGERRCCTSECCDTFECCCCAAGYCYRPKSFGQEGWHYCGLIWKHLLHVFYAASLWIVVAFLDGDWYVCIRTVTTNDTDEQIACKELPTPKEAEILRKYSSESRLIGLILIMGLSLLLTVSSSIITRWRPYYKSLFEVYLEQETCAILEEKLQEQAVERAKRVSEKALSGIHGEQVEFDSRHCQYQPLGNAVEQEELWRSISHPAFHLEGVRTYA